MKPRYPRLQIVGWNALGALVIVLWTFVCFLLVFGLLRLLKLLVVSEDAARQGLDMHYHKKKANHLRLGIITLASIVMIKLFFNGTKRFPRMFRITNSIFMFC